ncbi:MAG: NDP-sugar synthase [Nitrospinae bacterium]|nr:NDP-sugar synthase [Nitrospinota bacterium]
MNILNSQKPLKAMILAAGFGTRLLPLTKTVPKPMVPVLNRPLLEHTIELLRSFNITDIAVNVHHLPDQVIEPFGDGSQLGVNLHFFREEKILGTAGGIKAAQGFLESGPFLVINSDIIVNIDLNRVFEFHRRQQSCLTLVVREDASPEKYDPIEIQDDGRIVHFVGASSMELPDNTRRVMFTGIQIMEPEIFPRIPTGQFCGTTEHIFPEMIQEGLPVFGYLHDDYWIDMGNREQYLKVHKDALDGKILFKNQHLKTPEGSSIIPPVIIGDDCLIEPDARIGPYAVLGNGCRVKANAVIENSVLWDGVTVGSGCVVKQSILGKGVTVSDKAEIINQSLNA